MRGTRLRAARVSGARAAAVLPAALLALILAAGPPAQPAAAAREEGGRPQAGDYCPLPEPGETPECLLEAQREYPEFFSGLEDGGVDEEATSQLEAEVARGAAGERPYEALSSLAYGYYVLAHRAAETRRPLDPRTAARLERWNEVLARAFETSEEDPRFREAVETAATDIQRSTPPLALRCLDAEGEETTCDSTEAVLRGIQRARERTGIRGQLRRLLEQVLGGSS